jgi:hypothetical protein
MSRQDSTSTIVVSHPDFRLLVRDPLDNNDETTLVVPALLARRVVYARMLVDEGAQLAEHAVAFVEDDRPELLEVVEKSLSAARPTCVSFVRSAQHPEIMGSTAHGPRAAQIAACAVSLIERSKAASHAEGPGPWTVSFAQGAFIGALQIQHRARMFEVSWVS